MVKGDRGPPGPMNVFCTRPQRLPVADEMRLMGLTVSARLGTSMPVLGPGPPFSADRPRGAGRLLFLLPAISAGGGGDLKRRFETVDGELGIEPGETASDCAKLSIDAWCLSSRLSTLIGAWVGTISDGNRETEEAAK